METAPAPVETAIEMLLPDSFVVERRGESWRTSREERHTRRGWTAGE
jgi:hypothetical protein